MRDFKVVVVSDGTLDHDAKEQPRALKKMTTAVKARAVASTRLALRR